MSFNKHTWHPKRGLQLVPYNQDVGLGTYGEFRKDTWRLRVKGAYWRSYLEVGAQLCPNSETHPYGGIATRSGAMSGCELYFWKDGEVVVRSWAHGPGLIFNRLCVDTSETVPELRYGQFSNGWKHCKYEELPAEFRVHLLLMGGVMIPNTKHVYTWSNEQGAELPVGLMPVHRKGTVCACWNDFTQLWEFLEGDGQMWRTIFNKDAVPAGFRTYLLLLGLS